MIYRGFFLHSNICNSTNLFARLLASYKYFADICSAKLMVVSQPRWASDIAHITLRWAFFSPIQPKTTRLPYPVILLFGVTIMSLATG